MKKITWLTIALTIFLLIGVLTACEKAETDVQDDNENEGSNVSSEISNPTEVQETEPKETEPNYAEILPEKIQGVWSSATSDESMTVFTYNDKSVKTYFISYGSTGSELLSGKFTVADEKINYSFDGGSGYSNFSYTDGVLALSDANGVEMKKMSASDILELLIQEESCFNHTGVIVLSDILADCYPDTEEHITAQEKKVDAVAAIKEKGEAALKTLNTTYDKVQNITWYESKSKPYYIDVCCFIYPYIGRTDSGTTWLRVMLNYTDAQTDAGWIFFNTVIFSVDGDNTTKSISRSDIVRDNDTEVWETADFDPSTADVELLRKIADSEETIIRFQGDEYHYDHVVTSKEKTAIINVLDAYAYLMSDYYEEG